MTMRNELKKLIVNLRTPSRYSFGHYREVFQHGREDAADDIEEILNKYPEMADEPHGEDDASDG